MQEAIPYKAWTFPSVGRSQPLNQQIGPAKSANNNDGSIIKKNGAAKDHVREAVTENAVVVFARRGCCMSHVVKRLLHGHGVNPAVYEVEEEEENAVVRELETIGGDDSVKVQLPAVFIGGKLFGGLDRVIATHITGELIPVLKQAGALWL